MNIVTKVFQNAVCNSRFTAYQRKLLKTLSIIGSSHLSEAQYFDDMMNMIQMLKTYEKHIQKDRHTFTGKVG